LFFRGGGWGGTNGGPTGRRFPTGILEGDVIACAASASSLYVSLRDRGIVRLSLARPEVDPLAQARFGAMSRGVLFLGLATGSLAGADVPLRRRGR
jgi:hypothetical protein